MTLSALLFTLMFCAFRMFVRMEFRKLFIIFLVVAGTTFKIAQETTTIPQETCRIFTFRFAHSFIHDPTIDLSTLVGPNKTTLERLKSLVTTDANCSVVGEVKLSEEVSYQSGISNIFSIPFIAQFIRFQVSAKDSIKHSREKVTQLGRCLNSVQGKVGQDLKNSVPLNVSGTLVREGITFVSTLQKSCCAKIFGFPDTVLRCCRPDFLNDGDECACRKGRFLNVNETRCDACPVDTYQPNSKSNKCLQCCQGTTTYGETGADSLSSCLEACQPGEQYLKNMQKCELCPKDFYQPNEGQQNCIVCPSGEITRNTGSRRMEDCVQACPEGNFYSFASKQCELCPRNSFQSKFGQFNCTVCDADRVTMFGGSATATDCIKNCSRGKFFNNKTQQCEGCALHTYQPNVSATKCINCPNHGITVTTSSYTLEDCIKNCSAGSAYNFATNECESCQLNFYQSKSGQTKCIACPDDKITVSFSTLSVDDCIEDDGLSNNQKIIMAVVVILVVLAIIAIILAIVYRRKMKSEQGDIVVQGELNPYNCSIAAVPKSNINTWLEISRESLTMGEMLGQGEFGLVVRASWLKEGASTPIPVAVKTIKDSATETGRKEFFKELRLMAEISGHPNVVNLIGACANGGPLWIVVELCENGNLLSFLRKNRKKNSEDSVDFVSGLDSLARVRIAYDVSKGMHYLEDNKIVHRDLAARNILLGKNKIAKIADFGLSRDIYEVGRYQANTGGKLPVKWMAIESLTDAAYTSKSDVWSFGVLFWEIETAGVVPYPGIGGRDLLRFLLSGFRLEQPSETPFEIYEIMKKCWAAMPEVRPHFVEIEKELEEYLEESLDYLPVVHGEETADDETVYVNYFMDVEREDT